MTQVVVAPVPTAPGGAPPAPGQGRQSILRRRLQNREPAR